MVKLVPRKVSASGTTLQVVLGAQASAFVNENFRVTGTTQLQGNASVCGTLRVAGLTSLQGGLVVDTSMDVQTTMNANSISMSGTLNVVDRQIQIFNYRVKHLWRTIY